MRWAALPLLAALAGCSGQPSLAGSNEPILVHGAQFVSGPLPGSPPPDGGEGGGSGSPAPPAVTSITSADNVFVAGLGGRSLSGDVTADATAVAVRFADLGTGYWLFVPGPPDTSAAGQLTWSISFDVGESATPGLQNLRFAAVNAAGASGTQMDLPVCIDTPYPDNFNACLPGRAPPAAVLTLSWDTPVDLDLGLVTPGGIVVSPKNPTTSADGGAGANDGVLDRDSDANCLPDHVNREDIVWKGTPAPGQYLVYANLFSACGQAAVRFTLSLYVEEKTDAGYALVQKLSAQGEMLASEANGGAGMGLYVAAFDFPFP